VSILFYACDALISCLLIAVANQFNIRQGLTFYNGHIYEGTGMEYQSHLFQHDPTDKMKTLNKVPVTPTHLFGEGISHYYIWKTDENGNKIKEHRLIQITWKDEVGFIYSLPDLQIIKKFTYQTSTGEGWGITFVEHTLEFYVSDGSEYLMVWDAETLEEKRRITVTFDRGSETVTVNFVNELEFVDFDPQHAASVQEGRQRCDTSGSGNGQCLNDAATSSFTPTMRILANIWFQDVLVSIDPVSGVITRVYNLGDIYPIHQRQKDGADVLNGISVTGSNADGEGGLQLWVTGKLWPSMYRIQLID
jgi:glutamine cyclotransferase